LESPALAGPGWSSAFRRSAVKGPRAARKNQSEKRDRLKAELQQEQPQAPDAQISARKNCHTPHSCRMITGSCRRWPCHTILACQRPDLRSGPRQKKPRTRSTAMLMSLWIPIIASTIALFFASFLSWMVVPIHKKDWLKLEQEDDFLKAAKDLGLADTAASGTTRPPAPRLRPHAHPGQLGRSRSPTPRSPPASPTRSPPTSSNTPIARISTSPSCPGTPEAAVVVLNLDLEQAGIGCYIAWFRVKADEPVHGPAIWNDNSWDQSTSTGFADRRLGPASTKSRPSPR